MIPAASQESTSRPHLCVNSWKEGGYKGKCGGNLLQALSFPEEAEAVLASAKGKSLNLALSWFFIRKALPG